MTAQQPAPRRLAGFSLIELMVTVLVASILLGIAIPSYKSSVRKARRTDAKTALLDLAGREERYASTNNGAYTTSTANLGYSGSFPVTVGSGYYTVSAPTITAASATAVATFSITASPKTGSDQVNDTGCTSFTITNTGAQTFTGTDTNCW